MNFGIHRNWRRLGIRFVRIVIMHFIGSTFLCATNATQTQHNERKQKTATNERTKTESSILFRKLMTIIKIFSFIETCAWYPIDSMHVEPFTGNLFLQFYLLPCIIFVGLCHLTIYLWSYHVDHRHIIISPYRYGFCWLLLLLLSLAREFSRWQFGELVGRSVGGMKNDQIHACCTINETKTEFIDPMNGNENANWYYTLSFALQYEYEMP